MTDKPKPKNDGANGKDEDNFHFAKGNQLWRTNKMVARPFKFNSPDEFLAAVHKYFEWSDANPIQEQKVFGTGLKMSVDHDRPLTIASACIHMGINYSTWDRSRKREGFGEVIEMVESVMTEQKFAGAAVGIFNANIIARDLGMVERKKVTLETPDTPASERLGSFLDSMTPKPEDEDAEPS